MMVYLGYPIDFHRDGEESWGGLVEWATKGLMSAGVVVYDPGAAFKGTGEAKPEEFVRVINMGALGLAKGMLALIPRGAKSVGLWREVQAAVDQGTPVMVLTDDPAVRRSWSLTDVQVTWIEDKAGVASATSAWARRINPRRPTVASLLAHVAPQPPLPEPLVQFMKGEDVMMGLGNYRGVGMPEALGTILGGSDEDLAFAATGPSSRLPTRVHEGDAGLDLYVVGDHTIPPGGFRDIPVGVRVALPEGTWGLLIGRSSTFRKRGIQVQPGIIDTGYRGELFAACYLHANEDPVEVEIKDGERLAQLILLPNLTQQFKPRWASEDEFERTPDGRGHAGFGSSGV